MAVAGCSRFAASLNEPLESLITSQNSVNKKGRTITWRWTSWLRKLVSRFQLDPRDQPTEKISIRAVLLKAHDVIVVAYKLE